MSFFLIQLQLGIPPAGSWEVRRQHNPSIMPSDHSHLRRACGRDGTPDDRDSRHEGGPEGQAFCVIGWKTDVVYQGELWEMKGPHAVLLGGRCARSTGRTTLPRRAHAQPPTLKPPVHRWSSRRRRKGTEGKYVSINETKTDYSSGKQSQTESQEIKVNTERFLKTKKSNLKRGGRIQAPGKNLW